MYSKKCINNEIQTISDRYGRRLLDFDHIEKICTRKENFIPYIEAYPWDTTSLSHGLPGLACLFSELEIQTQNHLWANATHTCIEQILHDLKERGVNHDALFSGLSGICFSISIASIQKQRYNKLLLKLHSYLLSILDNKLPYLIKQLKFNPSNLNSMTYDYVTGISGVLSYLLASVTKDNSEKCIAHILYFLTKLASNDNSFFNLPEHMIREEERNNFPSGYFDTGFAHGITGVLAILSKALIMGYKVEGQEKAIQALVEQIKNLQTTYNGLQEVWPPKKAPSTEKQGKAAYRDGWCYGRPGISYSLLQASSALRDKSLKQYSIDTMASCIQTNKSTPTVSCYSVCHGLSSLLTASQLFYKATKEPLFANATKHFATLILSKENSDLPFGFKSLAFGNNKDSLWIDNPGLLDGTSGALLSLLTLTRERDDLPSFTPIFFP